MACLVKGLPFFLLFFGCTPRDLSVLDVSVSVDPSRSPHARRADGLLDLKKKTSRVFRYLRARLAQIYLFKKEKNQLFELISIVSGLRSDSSLPSLKGEKKTSFLFCVVWPSSLNAGRNGTRRDCATTIWNFFFLFFLSPTEFLKSKRNNTRKWEKIKKRISSCFYGPDVSGLSIPCVRLGDGIFFFFYGTVNSARGAPRILF